MYSWILNDFEQIVTANCNNTKFVYPCQQNRVYLINRVESVQLTMTYKTIFRQATGYFDLLAKHRCIDSHMSLWNLSIYLNKIEKQIIEYNVLKKIINRRKFIDKYLVFDHYYTQYIIYSILFKKNHHFIFFTMYVSANYFIMWLSLYGFSWT